MLLAPALALALAAVTTPAGAPAPGAPPRPGETAPIESPLESPSESPIQSPIQSPQSPNPSPSPAPTALTPATPATHAPAGPLPQTAGDRARDRRDARRGRVMTSIGATLTALGLAGRIGLDLWLAAGVDLDPRAPYGRWQIGPFFMATTFTNVPTAVGIGLLGGGLYREARVHGRRFDHPPSRRIRRIGWGLLGGGLGLWGLSRALFLPWTRACASNGCAYGYLESTYYLSAGMAIAGVVLGGREAGYARSAAERSTSRRTPALAPLLGPGLQGLSLSGRF